MNNIGERVKEKAALCVRPDVQKFFERMEASQQPPLDEMEPIAARALVSTLFAELDLPVGELAVHRTLSAPNPRGGEITLRLYDARNSRSPGPVVLFLHGGAWLTGSLETHDALCAEIARQLDLPVIAVDYRLAPENPWPAAPDDCVSIARWVAGSPSNLGFKISGLIIAGDSAGGTLAAVTALALRDSPAEQPVLAQWLMYPVTDLSRDASAYDSRRNNGLIRREMLDWIVRHYRPDVRHWSASPLLADHAGLPPTLVLTATMDVLNEQGHDYAISCAAAGVPTIQMEAIGSVHGCLGLRKALPSSALDLSANILALKALLKWAN